MGKGQRIKGAVYEREVMAQFNERFGTSAKRHIGQARDGGHDGIVGKWLLEMKRRKNFKTLEGYLGQAKAAVAKLGVDETGLLKIPIVVMRADNGRSMVLMDLDAFLLHVEVE